MHSQVPTIETCFNCVGTRSSDANRNNRKDDITAREIQKLRNLSRPPPPPWRERGVAKIAPVPEGDFFPHTHLSTEAKGEEVSRFLYISPVDLILKKI